jgi:16S rRNA C967 or C1407 C5-methylase (RsmB/RsmF family)
VYSTCSFIRAENEDVVQWLLEQDKSAKLIAPFDQDCGVDVKCVPYKKGYIENTIRFDPITSNTSGMWYHKLEFIVC